MKRPKFELIVDEIRISQGSWNDVIFDVSAKLIIITFIVTNDVFDSSKSDL